MTDQLDDTIMDSGPESDQPEEQKTFDLDYVQKLRSENAKYRQRAKDYEAQVKELSPKATELDKLRQSQMSDVEKLTAQVTELQERLAASSAAAERAQKEAQLIRLATEAGIDPEVAQLLDLSKLDLEDKENALKTLSKLAAPKPAATASNPARGQTPSDQLLNEWMDNVGRKSTIFGQ